MVLTPLMWFVHVSCVRCQIHSWKRVFEVLQIPQFLYSDHRKVSSCIVLLPHLILVCCSLGMLCRAVNPFGLKTFYLTPITPLFLLSSVIPFSPLSSFSKSVFHRPSIPPFFGFSPSLPLPPIYLMWFPFLSINIPDCPLSDPPSLPLLHHSSLHPFLLLPQWVLQWSCWSVRLSAGSTMTWTRSTSPATCSKSVARRRCCRSEYTQQEELYYYASPKH